MPAIRPMTTQTTSFEEHAMFTRLPFIVVCAIAVLGWSVGEAAKQMLGHIQRYERAIGAAIVAAGLVLWLWHHLSARRRANTAGTSS